MINVPGNRKISNAVFALDGQRIFYSYGGDTYERDVATYRLPVIIYRLSRWGLFLEV